MQEKLKHLLNYDPKTGLFTWNVNRGGTAKAGTRAGNKNAHGYIYINFNKKLIGAHRLAWLYMYGYIPECDIDHINRVKDDNRIENLRECTRSENMANSKRKRTKKSPYQGVCLDIESGLWLACITKNYKQIHLGRFSTPEEAHAVYIEKSKEIHGKFTPFV